MALVTVTGNVTDITGKADPDQLSFSTPVIRQGVLSTKIQRVNPNTTTGAFSVQLEAGPATVRVRGKSYDFTAAAGDLWSMIQVGLAVPPDTAAQKLTDAVNAWAQSFADGRYATVSATANKVARKTFATPTTAASSTLNPGVFEQVDATAGSISRKLAAGAAVDDQITVKVSAIGTGNTVTITGDTGVTAPTIPLVAANQAVTFSWTGSAWIVSGRDNPKAYLDSVYARVPQQSTPPANPAVGDLWLDTSA
ncbi:hypothetical protein [Williamsia serinedens]